MPMDLSPENYQARNEKISDLVSELASKDAEIAELKKIIK